MASDDELSLSGQAFETLFIGNDGDEYVEDEAFLESHVLLLPGIATPHECEELIAAADHWAVSHHEAVAACDESSPLRRASFADLDQHSRSIASRLIARARLNLQKKLPSIAKEVFGDTIMMSDTDPASWVNRLNFAPNEPAVNIYGVGGSFPPHEDRQALTLLVPLSAASVNFEGGGTGFWAPSAIRLGSDLSTTVPTLVVRPVVPGTAVLFGGSVTHAALPVQAGTRHAFVSSFTP